MTDPPPARPRRARVAQIAAVARELLESEGPEALTMRRLADRLGIRAPSIYKHFGSKHDLEVAVIDDGMADLGAALHRAVAEAAPSGPSAMVRSLLATYRAEALAHPNLYRLATVGPLPRGELTPGLEDWAGEPFLVAAGDPHAAQAMWAFAHGMVVLELDGRFPDDSDLEVTWAAGSAVFAAAPGPRQSVATRTARDSARLIAGPGSPRRGEADA